MIILNDRAVLEVVLGEAVTTNELAVMINYVDIDNDTLGVSNIGRFGTLTSGTTAVTLGSAPSQGNQRQTKYVTIFNSDTAQATVTVQINDTLNTRSVITYTLDSGSTLQYMDGVGWSVFPPDSTLSFAGDSGSGVIDLHSETLTVAGGAGIATSASGNTVTANVNINGATDLASPATGDEILVGDISDANAVRKADVASVVNLADHDALTNFVANEHIDHSGVNINAGTGLSGGGDLTQSRTLNVDIGGQTSVAAASSDELLIEDASDTGNPKKVTAQSIADLGSGGGGVQLDEANEWTAEQTFSAGLAIDGTYGIDSSGNAIFNDGSFSGDLSAAGSGSFNSLTINSTYTWASNGNISAAQGNFEGPVDAAGLAVGGTEVIDDSRNLSANVTATGSTTARALADRFADVVNVKDFGATGDGTTDDTSAIQAAIDYLELAGGGVLHAPGGNYKLSGTLVINKAIILRGAGIADDTINANGSGARYTVFTWDSAAAALPMIEIVSTTANAWLYGGEISGIMLNGSNVAARGIHGHSLSDWFIDVAVRQVTTACVEIDDGNGVLSKFNNLAILFTYGDVAEVEGAHGLVLSGEVANAGCTQNIVRSIAGLHKNGHMVRMVGNCDNNLVGRLHAAIASGGTGQSLTLENGTTKNARNNLVEYAVGDITAESGTRGNLIRHLISEGSGVTIHTGGQLHYDTVDYTNAELFVTTRYKMSKDIRISAGEISPTGSNATRGLGASAWDVIDFADSGNGHAMVSIAPDEELSAGSVTAITLVFTTDTANTSASCVFTVKATATSSGAIATPDAEEMVTITVPDLSNRMTVSKSTFAAPVTIARGDAILLRLSRMPTDAADTADGKIQLLSAILHFVSDGPDSPGSGPYDVGPGFL